MPTHKQKPEVHTRILHPYIINVDNIMINIIHRCSRSDAERSDGSDATGLCIIISYLVGAFGSRECERRKQQIRSAISFNIL